MRLAGQDKAVYAALHSKSYKRHIIQESRSGSVPNALPLHRWKETAVLEAYRAHVAERAALGIPALPLSKEQTTQLVELLQNPPAGEEAFLVELLTYRVPAGVDDAAKVKADFLARVSKGDLACGLVSRAKATELLGTMLGGFNIKPMIDLLGDAEVGAVAAEGLKTTLLMFDYFHDVKELAVAGNANAKAVMQSWADAEWFTSRPEVPASQKLTVFKVTGETNTDDLSPAPDAWSRPDIPLHALAMLKNPRPGIEPEEAGVRGPVKFLEDLKAKGNLVAYVGDVVGTGSSRKSATNSVLWFTGEDIPFVPNKRFGGVCLGSKIAPIFFNTMEDAGALPIEIDCGQLDMGDEIELRVDNATGKVTALKNGAVVAESQLKTLVILDEVRAGGRIPLIIGRGLTTKAREALGLPVSTLFRLPQAPVDSGKGFSLAQKMVGRACGLPEGLGIRPGTYCEPKMTTVGSQDTTGPMTRDELKVDAASGKVTALKNGAVIAESQLKTLVILDEVRAGGRIPLIIGRGLTTKAREALGLPPSTLFRLPQAPVDSGKGFSLAQKMVGRACGLPEGQGIRPGTYCEPKMTTVGSQDTTGPMTRDELKDLACLGFSADMTMQSFCHTAAYPKLVDVKMHRELPSFISTRGGVALRPGDGVIHSWLNRLLLPDTVGTGGDSHTRFPIGISFPAGSGLVAFAAATGVMPLDMPESVLVRFKGTMQPGVTLRDLVNAIPLYAIKAGLLTVEKKGMKNIFSGRILEIEGLPDLKVEQAFELTDASAERSAAGCTVHLNKAPIV
nr:aconitate hydratase B [Zoogloeaceae bacterium]